MNNQSETLVPIRAVVAQLQQLYPDLTQSSLRFLEREGLVEPARTSGGHRLYSHADIQRVRQIKQWQAHRLSLAEIRDRLSSGDRTRSTSDLSAAVFELYLNGRIQDAQAMILAAADVGNLALAIIFRDVITPVLIEVGRRWENEELQVSLEKEISEANRDVIGELSFRHRSPEMHGPSVVAAAVQGELHDLGLRMVSGVLGAAGFQVVYLGANVAPEYVAEAVVRHSADAVLLSAGSVEHLAAVALTRATLDTVSPSASAAPLIVGGAAVFGNDALILESGAIPMEVSDFEMLPTAIGAVISQHSRASVSGTPAMLRLPSQYAVSLADVERGTESG